MCSSDLGIYKNNDGPSQNRPDFTGYVYTKSIPSNGNGKPKDGTWPTGSSALADFMAKRQAFAACAASVSACENATGLTLNAKNLATAGVGGELQTYGTNRRLVTVPILSGTSIKDFACMLLLQPIPSPFADIQLEYVGNASDVDSPCTASGLPGGTAGPLVPVLVR